MLKNERWSRIIKIVEDKDTITASELSKIIGSSEATIRRDITELSKQGKILKVFGGISKINNEDFVFEDRDISNRYEENPLDKREIGKFASSKIDELDMVYLDAGTSIEAMIDFINLDKNAYYVTDSLTIAKKISKKGIKIHILPGTVKGKTDSVVGSSTILELMQFNFNKGFFGANGISLKNGFTTPDIEEAEVKKMAISRCKDVYVLCDSSKFSKTSGITFADLKKKINVITYLNKNVNSKIDDGKIKDFDAKVNLMIIND